MFKLFKRKEKVTVTNMGLTENNGANLRINVQAPPAMAMGMLLGALTDVAQRFKRIHDAQPEPCDCMGIRYADSIIGHIETINKNMAKAQKELIRK